MVDEALSNFVGEISKVVAKPERKQLFLQQVERARQKDKEWAEALQRDFEKALADPKLQDKATRPEGEDWEWENGSNMRFIPEYEGKLSVEYRRLLEEGFWRKPLPFSPYLWSEYYFNLYSSPIMPRLVEPKNEEEQLLSDYDELARLHDLILGCPVVDMLYYYQDSDECEKNGRLMKIILNEEMSCKSSSEQMELMSRLNVALEHVRADLEQFEKESQSKKIPKPETYSGGKAGDTQKRFRFNEGQAFFDGRDLGLPTGAEIKAVDILKKLVKSFGQVVKYIKLDKTVDPNSDSASDVLRQKILAINSALKKHKVPCRIHSKKWTGYVLRPSRSHS